MSEEISNADEICRPASVKQALARVLNISADQLERLESGRDEAVISELSAALADFSGNSAESGHLTDDQKLVLSLVRQLSEQEILYLLECAGNKDGAPDHVHLKP